jgi:small subunit ribosomal protein S16
LAVRLRLKRTGRRNLPSYKVVAADSRSPRDGRFIESLGTYEPLRNPASIKINEVKTFKWLRRGALPSDTVRSLLRQSGLWYKWYLMKKGVDETTIARKLAEWRAGQEAKLARSAERKLRRKAAKKAQKGSKEGAAEAAPPAQEAPATQPEPGTTPAA